MGEKRIGVYPGTFDPVTNGHMDVIGRATRIVDELVVGVAVNIGKGPLFSLEERVELLESSIAHLSGDAASRIRIVPFDNLLIEFVHTQKACMIVRGLRAVSDFEYEFQMASMNARLDNRIETVFLTASERNQFISSRFVKEIGRLGGDIGHFVTPEVKRRLIARFAELDAAEADKADGLNDGGDD
ncbi:MAG: pantetheine-phosphate adenylyltransferase [Rhodospirillales bacterium]|nr:pantetheine-phosphate adenylyltransferase [Rhodospirillales bacterium]